MIEVKLERSEKHQNFVNNQLGSFKMEDAGNIMIDQFKSQSSTKNVFQLDV